MQVAYADVMVKTRPNRENRRYWLTRWVEEAGGPKAFAAAVDTVDTHITAVIRGRRNIGDELANKIERRLDKEPGAMDADPPPSETVGIEQAQLTLAGGRGNYSRAVPLDTLIPQYRTGGSMGNGVLLRDQPGLITSWRVTPDWIQKNVHNVTSPGNLAIVTGFGDSMKPMFNPGDPLLVDRGINTVEFDGVYFFRIGNEGFIKRLQRVPGEGLVAISENKSYRDWIIKDGMDFEVFARVVKVWKGDDF